MQSVLVGAGFPLDRGTLKYIVHHGEGMNSLSDHQDTEHFLYNRTWEEIEEMLDKAEKVQNRWSSKYYEYQVEGNKKKMKDCARNQKALEGVIKTLRWVLGDMRVAHPLT
jgi:hypothetical protein